MTRNRFVTLTFDDGLFNSALKAVELLDKLQLKATFYIVTGLVKPVRSKPREAWNGGRDHGSWQDWRQIAAQGHEIGSHTWSHLNAAGKKARLFPPLWCWEMRNSYTDLEQQLPTPPSSVAMPWNSATRTSERYARRFYQAVRVGKTEPSYNNLNQIDWYRLQSWAPDSAIALETICNTIAGIPPNNWLILQFHGLDGEGWMPIESSKLRGILDFVTHCDDLSMVTVRDMVETFKLNKAGDV